MKKIEDYTPEELVSYSALIGILISRKFNIIQWFFRASILLGIARSIIITVTQERLISNSGYGNHSCKKQPQDSIPHFWWNVNQK